jgi:hypothetical protein
MTRQGTIIAVTLAVAVGLFAWTPARGQSKREKIEQLKGKISELQQKIDKQLQYMFKDQVQAAVYRSRLSSLQKEWQKLFAAMGNRPKLKTLKPQPPNDFSIEEVVGSDAPSLEMALATPSCKRRKDCRIWARIAFGSEMVKKGSKFELSADVVNRAGTKRKAVPAKTLTINQPVMVVDLPLGSVYLYKDHYKGTLRLLCDGRYKSKTFSFQLIR